ncbi:MAG: polyprenyl synthetase family protein [Ignavibacteriales bacterium]|nr:MAG: polyprenyl synthetase family protein [Ignavibacteriales bacterium]
MSSSCEKEILKLRKQIDNKLEKLFTGRQPQSLYEPSSYILEGGGKRLRPLLLMLAYKTVKGNVTGVINAAVAVELLHNFTLVHDDIMDNSDKRRGRVTIHKKYNLSTAILTGDNLLAIAYKYLIKDCGNDANRIVDTFTNGVVEVCEGQSLDKDFETNNSVTLKQYFKMIEKKTAALLETSTSIGAQLANATEPEIKALTLFGRYLGIAFQIQDDLLDVFASEVDFGKFIGGDIVEGKKTFLLLSAVETARGKDLNKLKLLIKNKGVDKKLVNDYKEIYLRLGIIEKAKDEVKKYIGKALKQLEIFDEQKSLALVNLTNSLIDRNY